MTRFFREMPEGLKFVCLITACVLLQIGPVKAQTLGGGSVVSVHGAASNGTIVDAVVAFLILLFGPVKAQTQTFMGNSVVSVYGAAGNGTTDDTAAFNKCLDPAINTTQVCWVDGGKTYLVGDVVMKSGMRLQGMGMVDYPVRTAQPVYTGIGETTVRPVLKMKPSSSFILDVRAIAGPDFSTNYGAGIVSGLFLDCSNTTGTSGISGGSFQLSLEHVTIVRCDTGFGGADITGGAHITNSSFGYNNNGIANIVDSFILNADFANNLGSGLYLGGGNNANTITNSRFEWNNGYGILSFGGATLVAISNCFFDRNQLAGIDIYGAIGFTLSNLTFQGNAGGAPDWENAQIVINESKNVTITGGVSIAFASMTGSGAIVPQSVIAFSPYAGASKNVVLSGIMTSGLYDASSNPTGGYTASVLKLGTAPDSLIVRGVLGQPDQ